MTPHQLREEANRVRAMPIEDVVCDPEWQKLRLSLKGNWKNDHRRNCEALRDYLSKYDWRPIYVRRVLNVLTGTVHRTGFTKGQHETDMLRLDVRRRWAKLLGQPTEGLRGPI